MNIFKKLYYRTYQTCMYCMIPFLPYREPTILTDTEEIVKTLESLHLNRVLLVTDENLHKMGLCDEVSDALKEAGILCVIYDKTVPNPTTDNVEEALAMYKENNCDSLIAIGGGSPMDCAKATGARVANPKKSCGDMKGILHVTHKIPTLIAIPTTAGTGSETTLAAVIVDSETRHKYSINAFHLIPKYAVLDYKYTINLPKSVTSSTGMDALTHAIEAYIGRSTTKKTRQESLEAVNLIFKNLPVAYQEPMNEDARENMLRASYLAGCAFTKSYVGYVHGIAHSLGGKYNIAHGLANAIILPYVLKMYGEKIYKKLKKLAIAADLVDETVSEKEAAETFIKAIEDLNFFMGIPTKVDCIKEEDIPELAKTAAKESNPLYPVPVLYDAKDLETIYYQIMK